MLNTITSLDLINFQLKRVAFLFTSVDVINVIRDVIR